MANDTISWFAAIDGARSNARFALGSKMNGRFPRRCRLDSALRLAGFRSGWYRLGGRCDRSATWVGGRFSAGPWLCGSAINLKWLDRLRDRFSVAGAKDDRHDAQIAADRLRTDEVLSTVC